MSVKTFFINAIKSQKVTGSILPSQRFLAKEMTKEINPKDCKYVAELGTGTGSITKYILKRLNKNCLILSFEVNKELINCIKIKRKNFVLINDDAQKLSNYLKKYGVKKVDYIISSIPLGNMDKISTNILLNSAYSSLKKGGLFIQYQYFLTKVKTVKKVFGNIKIKFVPLNIPPAFIYTCKK